MRDWLLGIIHDTNEPPGNAVTAVPAAVATKAQKMTRIAAVAGREDLVKYAQGCLTENDPDNAYVLGGFLPKKKRVHIRCTRDSDYQEYDRDAAKALRTRWGWYSLSSPREMFAEIYTKKYTSGPVPKKLNGHDWATGSPSSRPPPTRSSVPRRRPRVPISRHDGGMPAAPARTRASSSRRSG